MKNMKKAVATTLSAAMVMGLSVPAMAADVTAPIYSFDVVDVVVPTTYAVAFNPEGLTVKTGTGTNSTDQILSKNFGIINKSSKDKVITATLTVEDQNSGSGIKFVDSAQDITDAEDGEYKIHLTVVPADGTEVKIGSTSADKDTAAADLADVAMTGAASKAVTLKSGENKIGFKLDKATYSPKSGSEIELGTSNTNNVQSNFEITALAAAGKGITAFTFGGEMNANADWYKLTSGIKITAVYTNETAPSDATVITGTGAMVELAPVSAAPTFTTGSGVGEIAYTAGEGDDGLKEITKIEMANSGGTFDGYNAFEGVWPAAENADGVVTLPSEFLAFYTDGATCEATVTYVTNGNEQKTATVDVKLN